MRDGGVVRAVLDLYAELSSAGVECRLLTGSTEDRLAVDPSIELKEFNDRISRSMFSRLGRLNNFISIEDIQWCDCVHLHQAWTLQNLAISGVATKFKKPIVLSPHGMLDEWSLSQKRWKKKLFMKLCNSFFESEVSKFHCTAQGEMEQVQRCLQRPADDFSVIPLFSRSQRGNSNARPPKLGEKDARKILFLSRIHPKKGLEFLIDATAILSRKNHRVQLTVAGPGDSRYVESLKRRAIRLGLANEVSFTGMVDGDHKWSLYAQSDVFVLPTFQENFGLVLIEAMISGLPTITTKGTDIWPELKEANAIIAEQTAEAVAAAIETVCFSNDAAKFSPNTEVLSDWLDSAKLQSDYAKLYRSL